MIYKELSYIAGFLDGDGCIMLQLVYRHDYVLGYQIRASIVFYQKQQNKFFLEWLKNKFNNYGYIRNRPDNMSEYTIVGMKQVSEILNLLNPFLILKKRQAEIALSVIRKMPGKGKKMNADLLLGLAREVDKFSYLNYSKKRTNTSVKVKEFLQLHNVGSRRD